MLEATDEFIQDRLMSIPPVQLQDRHKDTEFPQYLSNYREQCSKYDGTFTYYMDTQEILYFPMDITMDDSPMLISSVRKMSDMLGRPHNYGNINVESIDSL